MAQGTGGFMQLLTGRWLRIGADTRICERRVVPMVLKSVK